MADPAEIESTLTRVLGEIREQGGIGTTVPAAIDHAERFVRLIDRGAGRLIDLGSGGGVPALVIAARRPDLEITMIERRQRRADRLRLAIGELGWMGRVTVRGIDVAIVASEDPVEADIVTARSFGPPLLTARWAAALLRTGGRALVSEPPDPDHGRWPAAALKHLGLRDDGCEQGIRILTRV